SFFNLPPMQADMNGDSAVTLADALMAAQAVARLGVTLPVAKKAAADLDLSGSVDGQDLALILEAVAAGTKLPDRVLNKTVYPGQLAMLVSPLLLDPAATAEVTVGGAPVQKPPRPVLGYLAFHVPFNLMGGSSVPVVLRINGVDAATYELGVVTAPKFNGHDATDSDPKAVIAQIFDRVDVLMAEADAAARTQIDAQALPGVDTNVLMAVSLYGNSEYKSARAQLLQLLSQPGAETTARVMLHSLMASGVGELSTPVGEAASAVHARALSTTASNWACDEFLPAFCKVQGTAKAVKVTADMLQTACGVLTGIAMVAIASPVDGPAFDIPTAIAAVATCTKTAVSMKVATLLSDMIGGYSPNIEVRATPTTAKYPVPTAVHAYLTLADNKQLCSASTTVGTATFTEALEASMKFDAVKKSVVPASIASAVERLPATWQKKFWDGVATAYASALGSTLSMVGLDDEVKTLVAGWCVTTSAELVMDISRVVTTPPPHGSFVPQADFSALYYCPPPGPVFDQTAKFLGRYKVCGEEKTSSATVICNGASVQITMGDNGSALDDIFEIQIGGKQFLTSDTPVRSVSKTIDLPNGLTEVFMLGHSAPDGIGTYFFSVSGATVVSGDARSGTDLTPGVTKRFVLSVP
ncbi:MAG: dockerin type I repeat-containing protein, partial [Planctomycetota bacterium]